MKKTLITDARLVQGEEITPPRALLIGDGIILDTDYRGGLPEDTEQFDAKSGYLLPAFIELHAHGGGGYDFADNTEESFDRVLKVHLSHGVTLLCPTLVACQWERLISFLTLCDRCAKNHPMFGGVHLEGPFLSPIMFGAQNRTNLAAPTADRIAELSMFSELLSRITAAPEVGGVDKLAKAMIARGVGMSVGHSNADADEMQKAADWGFDQVTHLFCSTSRRSKRGSYVVGGIEETALIDDHFTVEIIGDGHHVSRESLLLVERCKGKDGIVLVSDAMRAAGCNCEGENFLGEVRQENRVIIEDGVAKLPDRSSFAGSVAVGDTMVQTLCGRYGLPLTTVSHMMSAVPARMLGLDRRGKIEHGYDAELTLLDERYHTVAVFSRGNKVYEV